MKPGLRTSILAALLVATTAGATAQAFEEPSHPLSQINPIDVPLDMSDEKVRNVSVLSLSNPGGDGFRLDNYRIADTTGTNQLRLKPAQNQFQVQGSELNLSGNNLTAPKNIKSGGQDVTLRDSTSQQDILRAKEGGNIEVPNGNIDLQGNKIVDGTSSDKVYVGDGDSNTVRVDAGGSGNAVVSSGDGGSGSTERLRVTSSGGEADVDVSSSDIDLQGNSVTSSSGEVCIGDQCT